MASQTFVGTEQNDRSHLSFAGAIIWAAIALLAGWHRARFGLIELLFLFAPLVVVPLGLQLVQVFAAYPDSRFAKALGIAQLPATLAASLAFWFAPGRNAGAVSSIWLLYCVLLGYERLRQSLKAEHTSFSWLLNIAYLDLIVGAAWLVISRSGLRPFGFQEPIILLTAIHFHYSGFATVLIASATLREFERRRIDLIGLHQLVWLIALLPYALAAGFVFSPWLRMISTIALSTSVTALAIISWWLAGDMRSQPARIYLRSAGITAAIAFSLAGLYAFSEFFGKDWITIPAMANSHGVLNALGFVQMSMLGWLIEYHHTDAVGTTKPKEFLARNRRRPEGFAVLPNIPAGGHSVPEFVARDFYDR